MIHTLFDAIDPDNDQQSIALIASPTETPVPEHIRLLLESPCRIFNAGTNSDEDELAHL